MNELNICIVGCGNCCASIIMGMEYYKDANNEQYIIGLILIHPILGGYKISDIKCVLAYDIDDRKVGKRLNKAIFEPPNNTKIFYPESAFDSKKYPIVKMGKILDGFSSHLLDYEEKYRIVLSKEQEPSKEDIIRDLKETNTHIILNYTPVGSTQTTEFWAQIALDSGCAFINAIPEFIASNKEWADKFTKASLPVIGDDIKSQVGSTIVNRALVQMIEDRGGKITNSWQLNVGGNSDFRNMTDPSRLVSKKISKTESISSLISNDDAYVYAGPNGVIDCLSDNKISFMRIDFTIFGNIPCYIDLKLSVEDSPNSAGIMVDAIRIAKIALDRKIGGPILPACAYFCKHPPIQMRDEDARYELETFIMEN